MLKCKKYIKLLLMQNLSVFPFFILCLRFITRYNFVIKCLVHNKEYSLFLLNKKYNLEKKN